VALVLPGGQINPDVLRTNDDALAFIRAFAEAGTPVAAICHAPWLLVETGLAEGRTVTSWPSVSTDLKNAGAEWVDREVVVDDGARPTLITSRKPDDIPAFTRAIAETLAEVAANA
jgi:protease I